MPFDDLWSDVGEGWRWLEVGEVMACGDEVAMCNVKGQVIQWVTVYEDSLARGNTVTPHLYRFCRRRVTHDPKSQTPDAGGAWADIRRKAHRVATQANAMLAESLQKAASDAELLKAENATLKAQVERLQQDLSRMYLTKKERKAVAFAEEHFRYFKNQALTLRGLRQRLGGGS